jgi:hypothetical protein
VGRLLVAAKEPLSVKPIRAGVHSVVVLWLAALAVPLPPAAGQGLPAERVDPPALAIRAAGLVDVRRGILVPRAVVVVQGDRIIAVGGAGEVRIPAGAEVVDLGDATLIPT